MRPEISIIVPVYNTEEYLGRCIESILSQSFKHIELILVNDGSTDNSGEICEKYQLLDERVIVIHQENQGQGAARNKGLEIARGNFIGFVDSDDFIEIEMYEKMHSTLIKTNSDIVICQVNSIDEIDNVEKTKYNGPIEGNCETGREALLRYLKDGRWGPCDKLYKRCVVKNVKFLEEKTCEEDHAVMIPILYGLNKVNTINDYLYNYLVRTGSTTNSCFSIKNFDAVYVWEWIYEQSKNTDEIIMRMVEEKKVMTYIGLINGAIKSNKIIDIEINIEVDKLRNKLKKEKKVSLSKWSYRISKFLIIHAFYLYKLIYRFKIGIRDSF